ncbi:MAG: prephenate dehydratase [Bacteroidetes bacterium]|nr:prephenate dehydratase [Bacteroidota bacterium]
MKLSADTCQVQVQDLDLQRVAIMGTEASFHHRAAQLMLGPAVQVHSCRSFAEEVSALQQGRADAAIMAVENTIVGLMLPNLHQIVHHNLRILGELYLPIELQLLGLPGSRIEDVRTVYSHPYALQQCEAFLARFPHLQRIESTDTASAALRLLELGDPAVAAVASSYVGGHFGLEVLAPDIHTQQENFTRFMLLGRQGRVSKPTKATFWFLVTHQPGALAQVLSVFSLHNLNMTKITSIAVPEHPNEFAFLVEFVFQEYRHYELALELIAPRVRKLQVLGEYTQAFFTPYGGN